MPCYRPITAYRSTSPYAVRHAKTGKPVLQFANAIDEFDTAAGYISLYEERVKLPCGKCVGCRLKRSAEWSVRILHEARYHKQSSFLTLTYSTEHLPPNGSLRKEDFREFIKRLRERLREVGHAPLKYYMCGEYGDDRLRPHYHAILFGYFPDDGVAAANNPGANNPLWRSALLEETWRYGRVLVGKVTAASAAYVARYTMKKSYGLEAESEYTATERLPSYTGMSKGIGKRYFNDFQAEIYNNDNVLREDNLHEVSVPRYYDKLKAKYEAEVSNPKVNTPDINSVKRGRTQKARAMNPRDMSPERLAVREETVKLRVKRLRRPHEENDR